MNLEVSHSNGRWQARFGDAVWPCAVGRGGVHGVKREGDGITPAGRWPIRRVLYRPDRLEAPATLFSRDPLRPVDGWCDDPGDPRYNTQISLPYAASHEELWRDDEIYDVIAVLGYNDAPPQAGAGSAIFLHVARQNYEPTEGCLALAREHLLIFLAAASLTSLACIESV